jgi:hypothetical protein
MLGIPIFQNLYFNNYGDHNFPIPKTKKNWNIIFNKYNELFLRKEEENNIGDLLTRQYFTIDFFKDLSMNDWRKISNDQRYADFFIKNIDLLPIDLEKDKNVIRDNMIDYFNNINTLKLFENLSFLEAFFEKYKIDKIPIFEFSFLSKSFLFFKKNKDYLSNNYGEYEWLCNIINNPHPDIFQYIQSKIDLVWKYQEFNENYIIKKLVLNPKLINILLYYPDIYYKYNNNISKIYNDILDNSNAINVYSLFKNDVYKKISTFSINDSNKWKVFLLNKNNFTLIKNDYVFLSEIMKGGIVNEFVKTQPIYNSIFIKYFPNENRINYTIDYCIELILINDKLDFSIINRFLQYKEKSCTIYFINYLLQFILKRFNTYYYLDPYFLIKRFSEIITSDIFIIENQNLLINFIIQSSYIKFLLVTTIFKHRLFNLFIDYYKELNSLITFNINNITDCHSYMLRLDYQKMRNKCMPFAEELAAYVFHPDRLKKICNQYNLTFEEILEIY